MTVVECICADGTAIAPLVIFKGETTVQTGWILDDMDKDWSWTCNSKGWTCDKIGEEWIKRCFNPQTRAKANGRIRVLICDGHGSHISSGFIRFCMDNNISMLLMPPHSSHLCQPLDVGMFSPVKQAFSVEIDKSLVYRSKISSDHNLKFPDYHTCPFTSLRDNDLEFSEKKNLFRYIYIELMNLTRINKQIF